MGEWLIYGSNGTQKATVKKLEYSGEFMGETSVTCDIYSPSPISFSIGDYLVYRGERFTIDYDATRLKQARNNTYGKGYTYENMRFLSYVGELKKCEFLDFVPSDNLIHFSQLPDFSFYAETVKDLADRLQANLDRIYTGSKAWSVQVVQGFEGKENINVSVSKATCFDALRMAYDQFEATFIIRGRTITIGTAGNELETDFKYGKGNGLKTIERSVDESDSLVTRLRAYGNTTNLPANYYKNIGMRVYAPIYEIYHVSTTGCDIHFVPKLKNACFSDKNGQYSYWVTVSLDETLWLKAVASPNNHLSSTAYSVVTVGLYGSNTQAQVTQFLNQLQSGTYDKLYFKEGINVGAWPVEYREYAENVPNLMAIDRLMLPGFPELTTDPYIDASNISTLGVREKSVYFDGSDPDTPDIHPTLEGMTAAELRAAGYTIDLDTGDNGNLDEIAADATETDGSPITADGAFEGVDEVPGFKVTIKDIGFDINDYLSTETATLVMKTGMCGGREFTIVKVEKVGNKYVLECQRTEDVSHYSPYNPYLIKAGDKFVLTNIEMPKAYIDAASQRLLAAAQAYIAKYSAPQWVYAIKMDDIWMQRQRDNSVSEASSYYWNIKEGDVMNVTDSDLGVDISEVIDRLTIREGYGPIPEFEVVLRKEKPQGTIGVLQNRIRQLELRNAEQVDIIRRQQNYLSFIFGDTLADVMSQLDKKAETWYQASDPSSAWTTDEAKSEHIGDLWMDISANGGKKTYIYQNTGTSDSPNYQWVEQYVPDEVFDEIDGKAEIFVEKPTAYHERDMWIIENGISSSDLPSGCVAGDIVISSTDSTSFNKAHWSKKDRYTDDSSLNAFISGTYADDLQDIQNQIDGKAETWYQNTDPSTAWTTTALKNQHKGDIWHNSSTSTINGVKAGQDAIWNGTAWVVDETVPQAVYDTIDGKAAIYVTWGAWGNDLQVKDLFIPSANTTQGGVTYKANKVYRCTNKTTPTFQEIAYTDDAALNAFLNGYTGTLTGIRGDITTAQTTANNAATAASNANTAAAAAQATADALDYLKQAYLADNTLIDHGLILSTIVALRDSSNNVWSGISGAYDSTKLGNGIAAWYGGGMIDKEVSAVSNAAKSLFRFDGSGYVAGGNLSWDKNGNVTIQGYSINATTLQVGGSNVATQAMLDNFVSKAFFNRLFTAYDANGNAIVPNDTTTAINNLKIMVGAWTEQYLSALGLNSEGGGGGDFDEAQMWTALQSTSGTYATTKIATSHIPDMASTYGYLKASALSGYATQAWVNQQGFLTSHQTLYTLSIYGGTTKVLDFKPNANASIYIKAGGDISLTNDTTNKYITLSYTHPTNGANTTISAANGKVLSAITVNSLGHVTSVSSKTLAASDIPDLSSTYATDARADTLEGYFNTGGVAKVAAKLNTGTTTYTAWGQTYWSSGVPQSISGNMTSVGSITPSANGNALGTTSARFNIYGTSGNFSGNVSITGTLGVTGATTLTGLLTANGGIVVPSAKTIKIGDCTISWDSTNSMLKFDTGIYSTGAVSALGSNSSGGGGGIDIEAMWAELQGNTGTYANAKINVNHIPDISSTYGYAKTSQLGNYLPLTGGTLYRSTSDAPLRIKSNNTSGAYIGYQLNDDTTMGFIGVHATHGAAYVKSGAVYPILRSDNFGGYAYALYGGTDLAPTSTNTINLNDLRNTGSYYVSTNTPSQYVTNKPDDTQNYAFRVWVSAPGGTSGYRRQRFQYLAQMTIYERFYSTETSAWGDWYKVQDILANYALTSELSKYVSMHTQDNYDLNELGTYGGMYRHSNTPTNAFPNASYGNTIVVGAGQDTCFQLGASYTKNELYFRTGTWYSNGTGTLRTNSWKQVAFVDSNVASATKLQTAKTIWGQSFDGSDNVSGQMSNVGNIYPVESVKYNIGSNSLAYKYVYATWVGSPTNNILQFGANNQYHITVTTGGNVGIGTTSPAYKLDVNGDVRADNFRGALIGNASSATKATQDNDGNAFQDYYLRKVTVPDNTANDFNTFESITLTGRGDPTTGASLSHAPWTGKGPAGGYGVLTYLWSGYGTQMAWGYNDNHIYIRSKYFINGTGAVWSDSWSTIALTSDNVASATKLQTPRTIWGASFDGTANIASVAIEDVHEHIYFSRESWNYICVPSNSGNLAFNIGTAGIAYTKMCVVNNGNVGIGTTSPSYKLHVYGNIATTTANSGTIRLASANSINYIQSGNAAFDGNADMTIGGHSAHLGSNLNLEFNVVKATSILKVKTYLTLGYGAEGIYLNGTGIYWHNASDSWTKNIMSFNSAGEVHLLGGHLILEGANASTSTANTTQIIFRASNTQQVAISSNSSALIINPTSSSTTGQIVLGVGTTNSTFGTNIISKGEVTAQSDERLKTIVGDGNLDLRYIANAPNILFKWNNGQDDKVHGGSLAQYFLHGAKHFVLGSDKDYYSLNYGALATSMAISIAKEVVKHDDEITRLKKEVVKLRERVAELEERRIA